MNMIKSDYDLCVIGGGINGAGIARDAAGRGLRVLLVEAHDLAEATSSRSTKLIHGGLRYLEFYQFGLVRKALKEREVMMNIAPHIVHPMTFILPHEAHLRPVWMIRAGLFFYDHLARLKKLHKSRKVDLLNELPGEALNDQCDTGFAYADCRVDDARLVILNAIDIVERGGTVMVRTRCDKIEADPQKDQWRVSLLETGTGARHKITARMLVNAAGPMVHDLLAQNGLDTPKTPDIRLVKGSHIVVPRLYEGDHAYILQQPDQRIVFAIPYEQNFTLIGTTEKEYDGDAMNPQIDAEEIEYLCQSVNRSFKTHITKDDIVWTYSGVRPLIDDGHDNARAVTRDYRLDIGEEHGPLLLSVFGGKITTYRKLAEEAVNMLQQRAHFGGAPWTKKAALPGGGLLQANDFQTFLKQQRAHYTWMPAQLLERYAGLYGARLHRILSGKNGLSDMGAHYGDHVYEAEIRYLIAEEFARGADDILWRRTKLGLHITQDTKTNIENALPGLLKEILK